jgi:hypothetical protein
MTDPIRPPFHLVQQWREKWNRCPIGVPDFHIAIQSAQWGWNQRGAINEAQLQERADQELEACCEWLRYEHHSDTWPNRIRAARRPKPPSLKERIAAAITEGDERTALLLLNEALPNE